MLCLNIRLHIHSAIYFSILFVFLKFHPLFYCSCTYQFIHCIVYCCLFVVSLPCVVPYGLMATRLNKHYYYYRFPGGPLLQEFCSGPRPYRRIYFIDNQLTQSADRLSIQRMSHDMRSVSPLQVSEWWWCILFNIHSLAGYSLAKINTI